MQSFIDLFAGIGGFRTALQNKGMRCVFSSEIDKYASDAYKENFGELPKGDITKIASHDIPQHDVLCAGFPCQPFSISGNRNAFDDSRGLLFYEIVRIAKERKPLVMILENVRNILTMQQGYVLNTIQKEIENIGYAFTYSLLNSSHFGIPQSRIRVYMVCIRKDTSLYYEERKPTLEKKFLKDILIENEKCDHLVVKSKKITILKESTENELRPVRVGLLNKGYQGERIYSPNGHAITLSANGGGAGSRTGLYLVDGKVRKLHIDECKVLMGFSKKAYSFK